MDISNFLYPIRRYDGKFQPENVVFNANLQEFAQRVGYISGLVTNGKLTVEEAFSEIETLWQKLERTKKQLGVGDSPFSV